MVLEQGLLPKFGKETTIYCFEIIAGTSLDLVSRFAKLHRPTRRGQDFGVCNAKPETTHLKYRKRDGNTVRLSPDSERARPSTEVLMGVNDPYTESYYKNLYNIPAAVDENRAELRCFKWRDFSQPLQPKRGIFPPPSATHY